MRPLQGHSQCTSQIGCSNIGAWQRCGCTRRLPKRTAILSSLALFTDMDSAALTDLASDCEQRFPIFQPFCVSLGYILQVLLYTSFRIRMRSRSPSTYPASVLQRFIRFWPVLLLCDSVAVATAAAREMGQAGCSCDNVCVCVCACLVLISLSLFFFLSLTLSPLCPSPPISRLVRSLYLYHLVSFCLYVHLSLSLSSLSPSLSPSLSISLSLSPFPLQFHPKLWKARGQNTRERTSHQ